MENFEYIKPQRLADAIDALQKYQNAFLLAGGTDLLVSMKYNSIAPDCVIDIKEIPQMNTFECKDGWRFGALTTVRDIEVSDRLKEKMPCLGQAAKALGSIQIRNRGNPWGKPVQCFSLCKFRRHVPGTGCSGQDCFQRR